MMKSTLYILIILISFKIYPQAKLEGKYCSIPIGESDVICIDFQENNRFEYKRSGCLGLASFGEGSYELKNSTLRLNFDKKEQNLKSKVSITEKPSLSDHNVVFEFNIKDRYGIPLFVFVSEKGNDKDIGIYPEENKIILPKSNQTVTYKVIAVGYEIVELSLQQLTGKVIDIVLFEPQPKPISEQTISWELSEIKPDGFKTGEEFWNSTFRKVQK